MDRLVPSLAALTDTSLHMHAHTQGSIHSADCRMLKDVSSALQTNLFQGIVLQLKHHEECFVPLNNALQCVGSLFPLN